MYVPDNRTSKYMRQKLIELQRKIDEFTVIQLRLQPSSIGNGKTGKTSVRT